MHAHARVHASTRTFDWHGSGRMHPHARTHARTTRTRGCECARMHARTHSRTTRTRGGECAVTPARTHARTHARGCKRPPARTHARLAREGANARARTHARTHARLAREGANARACTYTRTHARMHDSHTRGRMHPHARTVWTVGQDPSRRSGAGNRTTNARALPCGCRRTPTAAYARTLCAQQLQATPPRARIPALPASSALEQVCAHQPRARTHLVRGTERDLHTRGRMHPHEPTVWTPDKHLS